MRIVKLPVESLNGSTKPGQLQMPLSPVQGSAAPRRFATLDVFTDQVLAGNPVAVVLDGDGLGEVRMRTIAREFNIPETVFVSAGGLGRGGPDLHAGA